MNPLELKMHSLDIQPPTIDIMEEGYQFYIQIRHRKQTSMLTDNCGTRQHFTRRDDAVALLRDIGVIKSRNLHY